MPKNKVEDLKTACDGLHILPNISRWALEGVEAIPDDDLER